MWHHGGECSSAKATHVRLQPGGVVTLSFSVCEPVAIGVTRGDGGAQRPTGEFLDKVLAQIAGGRSVAIANPHFDDNRAALKRRGTGQPDSS